jgi:hypothetical protein
LTLVQAWEHAPKRCSMESIFFFEIKILLIANKKDAKLTSGTVTC